MSDVLLIHPSTPAGHLTRYFPIVFLPAGILHAGTVLHHSGYSVELIDQNVEKDWKNRILQALHNVSACVGISTMTGSQIANGLEIAKFIRARSDKPIVWGGVHPTLLPEQTLGSEFVDTVVRGEGEETMLDLTEALKKNTSLHGIKGVSFKENGDVYHNSDREFVDLNETPPLAYELVDMNKYIHEENDYRYLRFSTSRGCVYNCTYCYSYKFHKRKWRALTVDNVINTMSILMKEYGVNQFWIDDDEFFTHLGRARELMKEFKKLNITWLCRGARIDSILKMDGNDLELMEKSGCRLLALGAESGSERVLNLMGKMITPKDILEANRKLSRYNIDLRFNIMMGIPTETVEDIAETVSLVFDIKRENRKAKFGPFSIFTPYPGCELYDVAVTHGFEPPDCLEGWAELSFAVDKWTWLPENMGKILKMLAFTSRFLNDWDPPSLTGYLYKAYRPIAMQRIKKLFYHFPLEVSLAKGLGLT